MTCIKTKETEGSTPAYRHSTHAHTHERNGRKLDAGFREGRREQKSRFCFGRSKGVEPKRGEVQTREKGETM